MYLPVTASSRGPSEPSGEALGAEPPRHTTRHPSGTAHSPIAAFTDDLHLEVINAAGCGDGVRRPDRGSIFVVFTVTWERTEARGLMGGSSTTFGSAAPRGSAPAHSPQLREPEHPALRHQHHGFPFCSRCRVTEEEGRSYLPPPHTQTLKTSVDRRHNDYTRGE